WLRPYCPVRCHSAARAEEEMRLDAGSRPSHSIRVERDFWEGLFQTGDTRFDLGGPTNALFDWLEARALQPGKALVPGCGRGYDVIELARRGWDALGVDFAPTALSDARRLADEAGVAARFEERDFFDLQGEALYNLWWENTCYCAVDPRRRDEYAQIAARL